MTINVPYWRSLIMMVLIGCYMIIDQGFMMIRFPPTGSFGVPIAEMLVMLFAATFLFELRHLPAFAATVPIVLLSLWWSLGATQAFLGLREHGIWALRDASHLIDSLFLWMGFVVAASPGFLDRFSKYLRVILLLSIPYMLLYPLRDTLAAMGPQLEAPSGYTLPLLFNYQGSTITPLAAAIMLILDRRRVLGLPPIILAGLIILFSIVLFQQRSTYLQIIALIGMLAVLRPSAVVSLSGGMLAGVGALILLLVSGIEIEGRLGEKFSLDFLLKHFAAIWGEGRSGAVQSAASGNELRIGWWIQIWKDVTASMHTLLFGLGYGLPLTDFKDVTGVPVREPHNSFISTFARLGISGVILFWAFHAMFVRQWFWLYAFTKRQGDVVWRNNLVILVAYFIGVWVFALGEDSFEKPFAAIPYYFFWGVIMRAVYVARSAERSPVPTSAPGPADPTYERRPAPLSR